MSADRKVVVHFSVNQDYRVVLSGNNVETILETHGIESADHLAEALEFERIDVDAILDRYVTDEFLQGTDVIVVKYAEVTS